VIGAGVALDLLLARTPDIAVSLERFAAYPSGFRFSLVIQSRTELSGWDVDDALSRQWRPSLRRDSEEIPPERLRFGVQFPDGSKATNVRFPIIEPGDRPTGPILHEGGGGGGGGRWDHDYWVWPLPTPGKLLFACEWPIQGLPLTKVEVDAGRILDAVPRSQILWPEERGTEGGAAGASWRVE
jgi:hypothetical protein